MRISCVEAQPWVEVSAPVDWLPLPPVLPTQPPDSVQVELLLFVLVLDHERVAEALYAIVIALLVLFAHRVTVGGWAAGEDPAARLVFRLRIVAIAVTE